MPTTPVHALADLRNGARRIAAGYIVIGLLWITGSDAMFNTLVSHGYVSTWGETLKGYGYVLVTGYLLYLAIARLHLQHRSTQQQLIRSEQAYRAIFDSHPNALWVYDPDSWRFLAANRAASVQFGYSHDEFLAMSLDALCPTEPRAELVRLTRADTESGAESVRGTLQSRTRDDRLLRLEATICRFDFNQREARLLWAIDITERSRVADELQEARRQLLEANRIAGLGYWAFDQKSDVITWSEQLSRIMGINSNFVPRRTAALMEWIFAEDRTALLTAVRNAWHGQLLNIEVRINRSDGELGYVLLRGELLKRDGDVKQLMGTMLDITERKRTEQRLQSSEQQYRQLIELMPLAVLILRAEQIVFANPAAAAMFGAAQAFDLCGRYVVTLVSAASKSAASQHFRLLASDPSATDFSFQERQLKKINGEIFSAEIAAQAVSIGEDRCIQVMVRDVSEQKKVQMELKVANQRLLRLSTRAIEVAEEERQQLSRELHDDIGQLLTFIKMSSAWIQKHQTDTEVAARAGLVNATAGEALQKVRNLALILRPAQLDTQGLKAAMKEHLHKFLGGYAIDYVLLGEELEPRPQPLIEMALFRIFQEALTNIIRHSGASHIEIELEASPQGLRLRLVDDGCGFDVAAQLSAGGSLGLHTMTERAEQLGGSLAIHAVAGVGTEIIAIIPCSGGSR
ncbi:MAG TPA: PAS domain S-box protein [Spongiibacteraceae bacterium]|nr:PAS domain S-box protein [Spongiibacteraceae bacterium]